MQLTVSSSAQHWYSIHPDREASQCHFDAEKFQLSNRTCRKRGELDFDDAMEGRVCVQCSASEKVTNRIKILTFKLGR